MALSLIGVLYVVVGGVFLYAGYADEVTHGIESKPKCRGLLGLMNTQPIRGTPTQQV